MKRAILLTAMGWALAGIEFASAVNINANIPGNQGSNSGVTGLIYNVYQFSLLIGGILAFGAIVYGGFKYTLAAGNPSGQNEGKEWVKSALLGLLLLVGAYVILHTINPRITNLSLENIENLPQ